jgi:hypothetical protein
MHIQKQHKSNRQSEKPEPALKRPAPVTPPRKGRILVQSTQKSDESEDSKLNDSDSSFEGLDDSVYL